MPAKSETQRKLMAAAAHGADFAKAKQLRQSMTLAQLKEFSGRVDAPKAPAEDKAAGVKHAPAKKLNAGREPGHPNRHQNLGKYLHPKKA